MPRGNNYFHVGFIVSSVLIKPTNAAQTPDPAATALIPAAAAGVSAAANYDLWRLIIFYNKPLQKRFQLRRSSC